ncbi:cell division protein FtsK [Candidatus Peregrinibacteria bacterium CG11_big_fil_rev_8_21_14_0_20_49_14]|nr:MAG: cell division protein FtsK [Candidatus Peregrinibacteria bacterium CG11_big_fil_rev_8_21_14_0_20_49_14]
MAKARRRTTRRKRTSTAARRTSRKKSQELKLSESTKRQISGTVQLCIGVLLLLVLQQQAGMIGAGLQQFLVFFFGKWGALFPATLICSGLLHWFIAPPKSKAKEKRVPTKIWLGLGLCLASFLGIVHIGAPLEDIGTKRDELAGAVGFMMSMPFLLFASRAVGYTVLASMFAVGVFIAFEPDLRSISAAVIDFFAPKKKAPAKTAKKKRVVEEDEWDEEDEWEEEEEDEEDDLVEQDRDPPELNIVRPIFAKQALKNAASKNIAKSVNAKVKDTITMQDTRYEEWTFPSYDLLDDSQSELNVNDDELKNQARLIEEKLGEFDIEVTVRDAHPGPTVTQFTLQPSEGVKLSRIANLKNDLALALAAPSLRIEAPIPGKSLVGVEMPNSVRTIVHLREILESPEFVQSESNLTLPLGRDVAGKAMVASLNEMPHLLIAGATGSGKSVCMNTFLASLLYQNAPDQLKLILIDPKRVELMPYDGIPHLLTPVITDAEKALQALRWAVAEMGRRLHRFSEVGARNIQEFNALQEEEENVIPRIVIVIDELADLMMRQYKRDSETMIVRISQMARAVGMHLIIATQRPSVDVITGLIKANVPTRIAFRVVGSVDSRTILDGIGAEDLLGKGDMLYLTAETSMPVRIQGIFTSTKEVERVINAVKIAGGGKITEEIPLQENEDEDGDGSHMIDLEADDNGGDELFFEAVRVVQETGRASASLLQRQLKVGYARAARLLDIMEDKGIVGPADGAKPRKVYIDSMAS